MSKLNILFIVLGSLFVMLGTVGIFVPVLPTTPFLLLAAACYAKGSDKLYNNLLSNRILGRYIRSYREGNGIPLPTKIFALTILWLSIGSTVIFFLDNVILQIMLLLIAAGVTTYLLTLKAPSKLNEDITPIAPNLSTDNNEE